MRRLVIWLAATVTIVVLLFGYHTSMNRGTTAASTAPAAGAAQTGSKGSASSGSGSSGSGSKSSGSSGSGSSGSSASKSYTGAVADTRWGPVEVKITVVGGKITKVDVPQYPNGNQRDAEINDYALPTLVQETIQAQSANIDMVSGATVTSDGYIRSLQSALDEAGI